MLRRFAPLLLLAFASTAEAQQVGSPFPWDFELSDFTQTEATALSDYQGRAVLVEFFAHW